eukprot:m.179195 g.179195  ORF g.179195 m.179195 type:complete len:243 (-) comp17990_c0_seq1:474-1202(-)
MDTWWTSVWWVMTCPLSVWLPPRIAARGLMLCELMGTMRRFVPGKYHSDQEWCFDTQLLASLNLIVPLLRRLELADSHNAVHLSSEFYSALPPDVTQAWGSPASDRALASLRSFVALPTVSGAHRVAALLQMGQEEKVDATLAHLDTQLACARAIASTEEYKAWLLARVRCERQEGLFDRAVCFRVFQRQAHGWTKPPNFSSLPFFPLFFFPFFSLTGIWHRWETGMNWINSASNCSGLQRS